MLEVVDVKQVIDEPKLSIDEIKGLISDLETKCKDNDIKYINESAFLNDEYEINIVIQILSGNILRDIIIDNLDDLIFICDFNFEKYRFLVNYQAIWSKDNKSIEAYIVGKSVRGGYMPYHMILRNFNIPIDFGGSNFTEYKLDKPESFSSDIEIKIKKPTAHMGIFCDVPQDRFLVLSITNIDLDTHDKALELLNKISNSIFFEMDIAKEMYFTLLRNTRLIRRVKRSINDLGLTFPKNTYDQEPMTLYWYARSAYNMPLLQYLAYYQAIEFYFPIFHHAEVSKKVRSLLKDPLFRYEKDTDIVKLISLFKGKGNGIVSEREQLKATLRECIDTQELITFIESNEERKKALTAKLKNITSATIQVTQNHDGVIAALMERIYSIRCKIVHVKADDKADDLKLLLPFSKEEEAIGHDIDLIQFIAKAIILHCSKSFNNL